MNNDIQMTEWGDIALVENDILPTQSIKQKIMIKLRWFFSEWRYNPEYGIDYFGRVFVKKPNRPLILSLICNQVRGVDGVIDVRNASIEIEPKKRVATIRFQAITEREEYDMELDIWENVQRAFRLIYGEDGTKLTVRTEDNSASGTFDLVDGDMFHERTPNLDYVVEHVLDGDLLAQIQH